MATNATPGAGKPRPWLLRHLGPVLSLALVGGIVAFIFIVYFTQPDLMDRLQGYGYLGAFVVSLVLNGTVLLPVGNMPLMASFGATLQVPLFVGLAGGLGAGIGEMTGYLLGRSGRGLIDSQGRIYVSVERWVKRWGWLAVFVLSVFPLIFDVVGIICGVLRMPVWRFFAACWLGRTVSYTAAAYLGSMWLRELPWWAYLGSLAVLFAGALAFARFMNQREAA
jgi:membrane protein YqaA with SNARE-associated domain